MSDRPADLPDWTPSGGDVVEPSSLEKTDGFKPNERPPAQYVNWFWELVHQWILWLKNGVFTRPSLTDNTPVIATSDRDGRLRHYLGPEGYWMGPAIQETYRWSPVNSGVDLVAGAGNAYCNPLIEARSDANCRVRIIAGSDSAIVASGGPVARLRADNAASDDRAYLISEPGALGDQPIGDIDNVVAVMEWRAYTSSNGQDQCRQFMGFHNMQDISVSGMNAALGRRAMIRRDGDVTADANWMCNVSNGSSFTTVDSGVTIVVDTWYTFRIEYHGGNSPVGVDNSTAAVARFFINGAEVAEITTANVPSSAGNRHLGMLMMQLADSTGPSADEDLVVGTVHMAWNEVLSPSVPA